MAFRFADSFDFYNAVADASQNYWDASAGWSISSLTRFARGGAMGGGLNAGYLFKGGFSNKATTWTNISFIQTTALGSAALGHYFSLYDGATPQCSVVFRGDGSIALTSGGPTGTVIDTWSGAFVANSYDNYQIQVVINSTTGSWSIKKNRRKGDATIDHTASGLNTRGGTTNNYTNGILLGHSTGSFGLVNAFDDLFHFDDDTSDLISDWTGDITAFQSMPTLDTAQKQFTQSSAGSLVFGTTGNGSTFDSAANQVTTGEVIFPSQGGTFSDVSVELASSFTGHVKLALYIADGNTTGFTSNSQPGTLVAVSDEVVNPSSGVVNFHFAGGPYPVLNRFGYFFATLADGAIHFKANGSTTSTYTYAVAYAGGFPANLAGLSSVHTTSRFTSYVTLTATNAGCVSDETEDGANTFLFDSTIGDFDLYKTHAPNYTPASVTGINMRMFVAKSDSAGRQVAISGLSGVTSFNTPSYSPLTTFTWTAKFYDKDPDTGAAWTPVAAVGLNYGPKIAA